MPEERRGPIKPMPDTVFSARSLTKTYTSGEVAVHALQAIDLEIFAGEVVVLLGPSGSGKSTLVKVLVGLYIPETGTIAAAGLPWRRMRILLPRCSASSTSSER